MIRKTIEAEVRKSPAVDELRTINRYTLRPHSAEEVVAFRAAVANSYVDRDLEVFSDEILEDFAVSLPGKSLLSAHEWGPVGIGRFYAAGLERAADGGMVLVGSFYMLRETDAPMIAKIEGGVAWAVSIGFSAPRRVLGVTEDGEEVQVYRRGENGEPGEAFEASLVFLGAQYGAAVTGMKAAGRKDRCGRDSITCELEAAMLQRELWGVRQLIDRARYDRPGLPRRVDLSLVELDTKRKALTERLAASCRGGM